MKNLIIVLDLTNNVGYLPSGVFDSIDTFVEQKIKEIKERIEKSQQYTLLPDSIKVTIENNRVDIDFYLVEKLNSKI
jgi:hypothetical protein